jgi:hypothetical protein
MSQRGRFTYENEQAELRAAAAREAAQAVPEPQPEPAPKGAKARGTAFPAGDSAGG